MASFAEASSNGLMSQNQDSFVYDGVTTKILCSSYADRHFVIVSQRDKIGNLISAHSVRSADGVVKFEVSTIFGKRDDVLLHVYARQIIEKISPSSPLPLLLGICLEDNGRDVKIFEEVLNRNPKLPHGLRIIDVEPQLATNESLRGYGYLIDSPDDITVENGRFEIVKWPVTGWRQLDPNTGDEGGTIEGNFEVHWQGDYFYGKNLAVSTSNNYYLDGLAAPPEFATFDETTCAGDGNSIYLWMSDYHPDGAQMFWSVEPIPFAVCLGLSSFGDDITPQNMVSFHVPAGKGIYIHPGTWHNGVYVSKTYGAAAFLTRQGKVHARVSASWASEFKCMLRIPLP